MGSRVRGPIVFGWSLLQRSDNFHTKIIFIRRTYLFPAAWFNIVLKSQENEKQEDCYTIQQQLSLLSTLIVNPSFGVEHIQALESTTTILQLSKKEKKAYYHSTTTKLQVSVSEFRASSVHQSLVKTKWTIKIKKTVGLLERKKLKSLKDDCSYYSLQYL